MREEYYVSFVTFLYVACFCFGMMPGKGGGLTGRVWQRLAAKDLDNWENRRVKRFEGEPDGVL